MIITNSWESMIMREIDSASKVTQLKPPMLWGSPGPSGGTGSPPGGFVGQLAQKYVTFDTTEAITSTIPGSETSLVHNLNRIRNGIALGNDAIQQRHIASGVGTLQVENDVIAVADVSRVSIKNSTITTINPGYIELEIIPQLTSVSISGILSYQWFADGDLYATVGFDGVRQNSVDVTLVDVSALLFTSGNTDTVINIETSPNGSSWTEKLVSPLILSSGSITNNIKTAISIPSGYYTRAKITTAGDAAAGLTILGFTSELINLTSELPAKQSGKYLTNDGNVLYWDTPIGGVSSVFGRVGVVTSQINDYTWNQINKTVSSLSGITNRSHTLLSDIGTISHTNIDSHISNSDIHVPPLTSGVINYILYTDGTNIFWVTPSGFGHKIQYNSVDMPQKAILNFTGTGIVVTTDSDSTNVTLSGGAGSGGHVIQDNGTPLTQRANLNFTGATVSDDAINDATNVAISISGIYATLAECRAGVDTYKLIAPFGLPLRVVNSGLIYNQPYGGNSRGYGATDLQSIRTTVDKVASGNFSTLIGGINNESSGVYATTLGGFNNAASGPDTTVIGGFGNTAGGYGGATVIGGTGGNNTGQDGAIVGGTDNIVGIDSANAFIGGGSRNETTVDGCAIIGGDLAKATIFSQIVNSSGAPDDSTAGLTQGTIQLISFAEIDHSDLGTDWITISPRSDLDINIPTDTVWTFDILISAATSGIVNSASYRIIGAAKNDSGTVSILAQTVTTIYESIADWDVQVAASTDKLLIQVRDTTETSVIRWCASMRTSEVTFA